MEGSIMNTEVNLCKTCRDTFATCAKPQSIEFGNGVGNDNVVSCSGYTIKENRMKITPPEGFIVDEGASTFKEIVFKRPLQEAKSWEELDKISGWFVDSNSIIFEIEHPQVVEKNQNVWATKEQAEACKAMSMLSQLMKDVNGGWKPNWLDHQAEYVISFVGDNINIGLSLMSHHFLAFETKEIRDTFAENHRDLIMKAMPLL